MKEPQKVRNCHTDSTRASLGLEFGQFGSVKRHDEDGFKRGEMKEYSRSFSGSLTASNSLQAVSNVD
jgi:hypothetical protein